MDDSHCSPASEQIVVDQVDHFLPSVLDSPDKNIHNYSDVTCDLCCAPMKVCECMVHVLPEIEIPTSPSESNHVDRNLDVESDYECSGNEMCSDAISYIDTSCDYGNLLSHSDKMPESNTEGLLGKFMPYSGYTPVHVEPELDMFPEVIFNTHTIGGYQSQMNAKAWIYELQFENDAWLKSYLLQGIVNGFDIVDDYNQVPSYDRSNYRSVESGPASDYIHELISKEIGEKKYIVSKTRPKCIHSMGAVPKAGGLGYRPITDCRQPLSFSINNYMDATAAPFSYVTVDYVQTLFSRDCFSATIDIASAYRSISVNPSHWNLQGIRWKVEGSEVFLLDTRLCFGLKCAPFIFNQISVFLVRCMMRRGFARVSNYLDDFICVDSSFARCQYMQKVFIHLLHFLGFEVSWRKCSSPSLVTRYLGIDFDSHLMQLRIPKDKMDKLYRELLFFRDKTRATRNQIERLCGILSHCSKVVRGGRTFSHRVIALLKNLSGRTRIRLSECFRADLAWWQSMSYFFNGTATMVSFNFGNGPVFYTDSSNLGYGLVLGNDWQAGHFVDSVSLPNFAGSHFHWYDVVKPLVVPRDDNINFRELIPVWQALLRFAPTYRDKHLVLFSDNTQVIAMVNSGKSSNVSCMCLLREIFWISVFFNVYITARYVPGSLNIVADFLSRTSCDNVGSLSKDYSLCCVGSDMSFF